MIGLCTTKCATKCRRRWKELSVYTFVHWYFIAIGCWCINLI